VGRVGDAGSGGSFTLRIDGPDDAAPLDPAAAATAE
jgi:hypothetical protein